ncbi:MULTISPECIES: hypothetical protein [unclassified Providencia]|uniref:hypothetical protein n=1 Tax=unclassified Providencia TaxID=2633465 RepID=UPI00234957DA|nr:MULTISPECIES: hypothetical protein [unclassified Providencia]WOC01223.1 hypothetical protein P3L55_07905 [Providencia sp. PROV046]
MQKIISRVMVAIALLVIFWSIYIGTREIISLFMIIPFNLVIATIFIKINEKLLNSETDEKKPDSLSVINSAAYLVVTIAVCWSILSYVNSGTALFGDAYKERVELENIKKKSWQNSASEMNHVSFAENRLKENLKDPSSAEFRDSRMGSGGSVCGQVNSKNGFGAYTGYKKYIQIGPATMVDDGSDDFNKQWESYCN